MALKDKLKIALAIASPFLGNIMEEKVIPKAIKIGYELLDNFIDSRIEALVDLLDKATRAMTPEKKERHIKGFTLGLNFLQALAKKLTESCEVLNKELEEMNNGV